MRSSNWFFLGVLLLSLAALALPSVVQAAPSISIYTDKQRYVVGDAIEVGPGLSCASSALILELAHKEL